MSGLKENSPKDSANNVGKFNTLRSLSTEKVPAQALFFLTFAPQNMATPEGINRKRDRNPTSKIWAVFLVSLATIAGAFYWSYTNFVTLTESLDALTHPSEEANLISEVFQEIIQAENHIHSFMLTGDTLERSRYRARISTARHNITSLKNLLLDDSLQAQRVDTLQAILDLKINYLERFLRVKKLKQSSLFTSEAMERIAEEVDDTASIDKQLLKREVIKGQVIPVEKQEIVITPDQFRGISGFLRKVFGRSQTRIDTFRTLEAETSYTYNVAVDTSIVRDYFRDSTLVAVKDILAMVLSKEITLQERITETEMRLMRQNKVFIANIRMVIEQLREREKAIAASNRKAARDLVDGSVSVLFLIGCSGVLMSGIFIFFIFRDITRAYRNRRQLELEKAKAEKLARVKEDFLSNMSHEIRTPLHNILGFSTLLEQTSLDPRQQSYMKAIRESHRYLSGLVNNILDQAKINAGKLRLRQEAFDPVQLVSDVTSSYEHTAASKKLLLNTVISDDVRNFHLVGDIFRIRQILHNLLSNAVKFTDTGSITVTAAGTAEKNRFNLEINVTDTGVGIEEDKLMTIFEPFEQAESDMERASGGTGLGLSITRSLVEMMQGTITAERNPPGGTVFRVRIALPSVPAPVIDAEEVQKTDQGFYRDCSVLVVEDDHWSATLLGEILRPRVRRVTIFHDAREALTFAMKFANRPDLVLTDINLPVMGGEQFRDEMKALYPDIPIVAVTAHVQREKFDALREGGFDDICTKPFTIAEIEGILSRYSVGTDETSIDHVVSADDEDEADFSLIRAFSGEDDVLFNRLLAELVENNARQVGLFGKYLQLSDAEGLSQTGHQMKTTYDTLRLSNISESLGSIELHHQLGNKDRLFEIARQLHPRLVAQSTKIAALARQYHTV